MTQRDPDKMFNEDQEDEIYNEQYSIWKEDRELKFGSNQSKMSKKIPLSRFGLAFLILLILLILLYARHRNAVLEDRMVALENKVQNVEETAGRLSAVGNQLDHILEQTQMIQQLKERFDRSEAALTSKMDQITINLSSLQKQISVPKTPTSRTSKSAKRSSKTTADRYHIVKPGETLYQIGPRYGLTVKQLRQINKLGNDDTIYPGQKLVISP